mmetsp:Transcript_128278/g.369417  ORF Transcript_128278/g.369417 Transcript_128278/m.369417 type:complete len:281 (+) Transcript_128278:364-1206(+)
MDAGVADVQLEADLRVAGGLRHDLGHGVLEGRVRKAVAKWEGRVEGGIPVRGKKALGVLDRAGGRWLDGVRLGSGMHDRQLAGGRAVAEKNACPSRTGLFATEEHVHDGEHIVPPRHEHRARGLHQHDCDALSGHGRNHVVGAVVEVQVGPVEALGRARSHDGDDDVGHLGDLRCQSDIVARARDDDHACCGSTAGDGVQWGGHEARQHVGGPASRIVVGVQRHAAILVGSHVRGGSDHSDGSRHVGALQRQDAAGILQQNDGLRGRMRRELDVLLGAAE